MQEKNTYNLENLKALEHSLEAFTLQEIQVKASRGRMEVKYTIAIERTLTDDSEPIEWEQPQSCEFPLAVNSKIFDLLHDLRIFCPPVADSTIDEVEVTKIKFRKIELEDAKGYDLNVYYQTATPNGKKSKQNTNWQSVGELAEATKTDYEQLEGLLTEIELNAYQYAVCGTCFPEKTKKVEVSRKGEVDFD